MPSWTDIAPNLTINTFGRTIASKATGSSDNSGFALLESQAILKISGDLAVKFLQGQSTADIEALKVGDSTIGAICTNKGRVICTYRVLRTEDGLLLRLAADMVESTAEYLTKFAVFFKVEMTVWPTPSVLAVFGKSPIEEGGDTYVSTMASATTELYIPPGNATTLYENLSNQLENYDEDAWHMEQIKSGIANIGATTSQKFLPHQLNLDRTGAVSFTKGCYTGQEIIARTEYRGKSKKRIRPLTFNTAAQNASEIRIETDSENPKSIEVVNIAIRDDEILCLALLELEAPDTGVLILNGEKTNYETLQLPYSFEDS